MTGFWWLLLGLLGGWLIELAIDYTWWRKRHRAAADEAARRLGEIDQVRKDLDSRDARLALRERDAGERETVEEYVARGGRIEVLQPHACSPNSILRFDHTPKPHASSRPPSGARVRPTSTY